MKLPILSLLILISIMLNGCLVDRIKQRIYVNQLRENSKLQKTTKTSTVTTSNTTTQNAAQEVEITPNAVTYPTRTLYKPSASNLATNTTTIKTYKAKKKVIKKSKKKVVKKSKKRVKKSKKIALEPYSIEKDESDPELLGPQTTLESNPLAKKKSSSKVDKI